jgi:hypothetical protein
MASFDETDDMEMKQEVEKVHPISGKDFVAIGTHADDDFSDSDGDENDEADFVKSGKQVNHDLLSRSTEKRLEDTGVIKGKRSSNLSSLLAAPVVSLEHQMAANKLSHDLKSHEPHQQRTSNLSSVLAAPASELNKHMTADKLSRALHEERKSGLEMSGHNKNVSSVLLSTQHQLEKQMTMDVVSHSIADKPVRKSDLGNMSALLAAPAKELEKSLKMNAVSHKLGKRSSQSELIDRGVLPSTKISPVLAAPARELEKHITSDKLNIAQRTMHETGALGAKERLAQYQQNATAPAAAAKIVAESTSSLKDRVVEYQKQAPQATSKLTMNPLSGGISLKDRMSAYAQAATSKPVAPKAE